MMKHTRFKLSRKGALLLFSMLLVLVATVRNSESADGFSVMALDLGLTGQSGWGYYNGGDSHTCLV